MKNYFDNVEEFARVYRDSLSIATITIPTGVILCVVDMLFYDGQTVPFILLLMFMQLSALLATYHVGYKGANDGSR